MSARERFVAVNTIEPAPAGAGFGMVSLTEIHSPDGPPRCRTPFWHAFSSADELREFLDAAFHDGGPEPQRVVLREAGRRTEEAAAIHWHPMSRRDRQDCDRLQKPLAHKEPPRRCPARR